ncbi:hypothetical protein GF327_07560 [Candidatus Woesearchaeota archaeon]|nr:hypothetical protein [Candidatus Woesearchaeota archaeon]
MKIPLSEVKKGETVKVNCVSCGFGLIKRLSSLGLYNGSDIKVIKNDSRGPLILKVLNSKIAIGRGQARKIIVEK